MACPRRAHTYDTGIATTCDRTCIVEDDILDIYALFCTSLVGCDTAFCQLIIGLAVHYTDKTATSLAKQIDIKVTDSVALTVEIAIEGSILATNLCKKWSDGSACFYVSLVVFSQVDVGCQLRTGIQMLRSIVAPPQELLRSTNFVPSINGSHIVLLYCSAVFADTHFVEFVRIENGVTCRSILIYSTHRCAITRVACSISINKGSFFLDRQRSWVNTYPLIEALNTALLSIQEIGKFATFYTIFIFEHNKFVLVSNLNTCKRMCYIYIIGNDIARVTTNIH